MDADQNRIFLSDLRENVIGLLRSNLVCLTSDKREIDLRLNLALGNSDVLYELRAASKLFMLNQTEIDQISNQLKQIPDYDVSVFLTRDTSPLGIPLCIRLTDNFGGSLTYDGLMFYYKKDALVGELTIADIGSITHAVEEYTVLIRRLKELINSSGIEQRCQNMHKFYTCEMSGLDCGKYNMYYLAKCIDEKFVRVYSGIGRAVRGKEYFVYFGQTQKILTVLANDILLKHRIGTLLESLRKVHQCIAEQMRMLEGIAGDLSLRKASLKHWGIVKEALHTTFSARNTLEVFEKYRAAIEFSTQTQIGYVYDTLHARWDECTGIAPTRVDSGYQQILLEDDQIVIRDDIQHEPIYVVTYNEYISLLDRMSSKKDELQHFSIKLLGVIQTEYTSIAAIGTVWAVVLSLAAIIISIIVA